MGERNNTRDTDFWLKGRERERDVPNVKKSVYIEGGGGVFLNNKIR